MEQTKQQIKNTDQDSTKSIELLKIEENSEVYFPSFPTDDLTNDFLEMAYGISDHIHTNFNDNVNCKICMNNKNKINKYRDSIDNSVRGISGQNKQYSLSKYFIGIQ